MNAPIDSITALSAHTHVGTAPPGYQNEWVTHTVHYHGFPNLSSERDEFVDSPEFEELGNLWRLRLYPGGCRGAAEGKVFLYLWNMSDKAIEMDYDFSVNGNGKQVAYERSSRPHYFAPVGTVSPEGTGLNGWGFSFVKRSKLLSSLFNGTLVIEVHMRLAKPTKSVPPPFIPENPSSCKTIAGVFLDDKYSDIMFEVGGDQRKDNAMKVAKIARERFPAHRLIVANCSSILANLCASHNDDTTTPIQINDVTPDIFRLLLSYIYGVKISDDDMKSHARDIIDAADKYGVVNLKLVAEASLVEDTIFTIENVMELLLYAESKNLALLKEAAMDYIVENKNEVQEKLSFADTVPGNLMRDLLAAMSRGERAVAGGIDVVGGDSHYNALRISELRKRAHEKGLNVDGSREMLIASLKTESTVISQLL
jgi:hypothetical protein